MGQKETKKPELPGAFSLFRPSIEALRLNIWTFLSLALLTPAVFLALAVIGGGAVDTLDSDAASVGNFIFSICATAAVALVMAPALAYLELASVRGERTTFEEATRAGLKHWWRFLAVTLVSGLAIAGGFILLIVPGFFMARRYIFAPYYVFDHKGGTLELMRQSAADSKQFSGAVWGVIGVNALIGLLGVLPILIPVAIILQMAYYCAAAVRYEQIRHALSKKHAAA